MEAGTLHCPCCGASISQDCTQCQYCHSLLQTVACPSCFGLMFLGSKFCPRCGAAAAGAQAGPTVTHECPRCPGSHLQIVVVGGVQLEECGHCGGLWVASAVFDKICADRETQESAVNISLPPAVPQEQSVRYLKCPQCANLMNRYNFASRSGVVIDKCKAHGIWLDRDEIRRIIEFIRAGGLTRARESEIEELKRQRRELETGQHASGIGSYTSYSPGVDSDTGSNILGGIASVLLSFLG